MDFNSLYQNFINDIKDNSTKKTMETKYTVDYFIDKFEKIPEEKFTKNVFHDSWTGAKCFVGHCLNPGAMKVIDRLRERVYFNIQPNLTKEESDMPCMQEVKALHKVCKSLMNTDSISETLFNINNGNDPRYQQTTIKQRILAALYDIKAMQEPKEKVVYKTVYIAEKLKELELVSGSN